MKKFLLFLLVLHITTANLFAQTEVVIENFDSWGANGYPSGFEGYRDSTWDGSVLEVAGYSGSAIKITDLFWNINNWGTIEIRKFIDYVGIIPDSVKVRFKQSNKSPSDHRIMVFFLDNWTNLAWFWESSSFFGDSINWGTGAVRKDRGIPGTNFNRIQIEFEIRRTANSNYEWRAYDDITLVWNCTIYLIEPTAGDKWIAGEKRIIKWSAINAGDQLKIEFSEDGGLSYILLEDSIAASAGQFEWNIPDDMLTTKAKIKLTNLNDNNTAESEIFKIKPYIITKLDGNGDYIAYDIDTDRWGFGNYPNDMWPPSYWYGRFDYNIGIDPFTNSPYNQRIADSTFYFAYPFEFPDWPSFVRAFGVDNCYWSTTISRYKSSAVLRWKSKKRVWGGSCFGIAAANALAFRKKNDFMVKYATFPNFVYPHNVNSDTSVIPIITELFAQQYGNPTILHRDNSFGKTVNQTLNDIKAMLIEDNTPIRTLSMWNNGSGGGGHTIIPYQLEQNPVDDWLYYLWVYDNSYPNNTTAIITIDTTAYSNTGRWDPVYGWNNWGGDIWFFLEVISDAYLNYPTLPKSNNNQSPSFFWPMGVEIDITENSDIVITDSLGNKTGYSNNTILDGIPNGLPLIVTNGSEGPPYGYLLGIRNYSIELNNFTADTIDAYFFSENKSFSYERYRATNSQTDRLFFDGGVSVTNPDAEAKSVKLLNIISDTTSSDEKLFLFRSLNLAQNDSVKIINPDNNRINLISYGSQKNYQVELEYVSDVISSRFLNDNVSLSANTTHKLVPNWGDFADLFLTIYVDEGNNGTIDDTLVIQNQATGVGEDQGSLLPTEFRLEQNYPNPFNNSTVIKYSIPKEGLVTLKIYNAIGEEVATLINETKQPGNYDVTFDTEKLTSGVYFYRIQVGSFVQTKKMVLMK